MSPADYRAEVIQFYLDLPDTPDVARDNDWIVAADLHRQNVPLHTIAHALRLATLRRHCDNRADHSEAVHSLAYYRRVIVNLTPDEHDPDYVAYVEKRFRLLIMQLTPAKTRSESRYPAVLENR